MTAIRQSSFAKGEVSPDVYGRKDQALYKIALRTLRNWNNQRFGGVQNRPGSQFISRVKTSSAGQVKLIPFIFSQTLSFILEFGNLYVRFIKNGAQVLEAAKTITGITSASPGVVTSVAHGYSNGQEIALGSIEGMTELNGRNVLAAGVTADTFQLADLDGTLINTTSFGAYTSGGTAQRVYELTTPYATADLQQLNYIQSANVITIAHQNYPPADVSRTADASWTYTPIVFKPGIDGPTGIAFVPPVVADTPIEVTGITNASPMVITRVAHGLSNGDKVTFQMSGGMLELNVITGTVVSAAPNTFEVYYFGTTTKIDSTGFSVFAAPGTDTVTRITAPAVSGTGARYQVTSLAATGEESLPGLAPPQTIQDYVLAVAGDLVTLMVPAHGLSDGDTVSVAATNPTKPVTFIAGNGVDVTFTSAAHGLTTGDTLFITDIPAFITAVFNVDPNDQNWAVVVVTPNTYTLVGVTTAAVFGNGGLLGFISQPYLADYVGTWTIAVTDVNHFTLNGAVVTVDATVSSNTNGTATLNTTIQVNPGTVGTPNVLSWAAVPGAIQYNVYRNTGSLFEFIGSTSTRTFSDIGIAGSPTATPPIPGNPFASPGNYPAIVCYYQQRLCFANTQNNVATVWCSKPGLRTNFTTHFPLYSDDAITFTLVGNNEVNPILGMVDLRRLVIFTSAGEWQVAGNVSGALTAIDPVNATQTSTNGSNGLRPLVVNASALYSQAQSSMVRDLRYEFTSDNYDGAELSIDSSHLIDGHTLTDWAFQKSKFIVWAVRSDGQMVALTYVREQQVNAWSRHDWVGQTVLTGGVMISIPGVVENVASVPEGEGAAAVSAIYVVVKRQLGRTTAVRYIERLSPRTIEDVRYAKFMDSSLTYDGTNLVAGLTMIFSGGTNYDYAEHLTLTASSAYFTTAHVGDAIFVYSTPVGAETPTLVKFVIDTYVSSTVVQGHIKGAPVPAQLRSGGTASENWARAVKTLTGLWHLAGNCVSIFGDACVVANPFNSRYPTRYTVSAAGRVTLDTWYAVVTLGLPITSDIETMDIDSPNSETTSGKKNIVTSVTAYLRSARGLLFGQKAPAADAYGSIDTSQTNLERLKPSVGTLPDAPNDLLTDPYTVPIQGSWTRGGRVFVRQTDPLPATILELSANGNFPFRQEGAP